MPAKHITLLVLLIFSIAVAQFRFSVDPSNHQILDEYSRQRFFHGVNVVYKTPPYLPSLEGPFNPVSSFTQQDIDIISDLGFNMVRLGTMWSGISIGPNQVNNSYIQELTTLLERLDAKNIVALADFHQDVISRAYCGEGAPTHIVDTFKKHYSGEKFPHPIFHNDFPTNENGDPTLSECLKHQFFEYYFTDEVGNMFTALYKNKYNIRDDFIASWKALVSGFKNSPSAYHALLGVELINEPWPCSVIQDSSCALKNGKADLDILQPFYDIVSSEIRTIDDSIMVFFESSLVDYIHFRPGFSHVPGGSQYVNSSVFSMHVYCGGVNRQGHPSHLWICNETEKHFFDEYFNDMKSNIGGAGFLTEFGALDNSEASVEIIDFLLDLAEDNLISNCWWAYKSFHDLTTQTTGSAESLFYPNGTIQDKKARALSRTYAQAIAGIVSFVNFNPDTSVYELIFAPNPAIKLPTEIFFSQKYHYPNGPKISIHPLMPFKILDSIISIQSSQAETVTVTISP